MERTDVEGEERKRERDQSYFFASGASVGSPMRTSVGCKRGKIHLPRTPEGFGVSLTLDNINDDLNNKTSFTGCK